MSMRASQVHGRADLFETQGVLRVVRPPLPAAPPAPAVRRAPRRAKSRNAPTS